MNQQPFVYQDKTFVEDRNVGSRIHRNPSPTRLGRVSDFHLLVIHSSKFKRARWALFLFRRHR